MKIFRDPIGIWSTLFHGIALGPLDFLIHQYPPQILMCIYASNNPMQSSSTYSKPSSIEFGMFSCHIYPLWLKPMALIHLLMISHLNFNLSMKLPPSCFTILSLVVNGSSLHRKLHHCVESLFMLLDLAAKLMIWIIYDKITFS